MNRSPAANTTSGPTWRRTSSSKRLALFWGFPAKKTSCGRAAAARLAIAV